MPPPALILVLGFACTPRVIDDGPSRATTCGEGFLADGSDCVPEDCGGDRWGAIPIDDATIFVDGLAPEGGDGTEAAPYSVIQRGLDRAGTLGGGLVAVAAGTYPETLEFTTDHADVRLAGRCRDLVVLDASVGDGETAGIAIDTGYGAVEVSGISVWGSSWVGLGLASGAVAARAMTISGSSYWGVAAVHPDFSGSSDLLVEDSLIVGNAYVGLLAADSGTTISLRDTILRDSRPDSNGDYGLGIQVTDGATLDAEACLIDGNSGIGLLASDAGTQVALRDVTVRDTQPDANGAYGRGIQAQGGVSLDAERSLIEGNSWVGLFVSSPGTQVNLRGTTVRGTRPDANGEGGWGIEVTDGAILSVEGGLVQANTEVGLVALDPGTTVSLQDATVRGTLLNAGGGGGYGIQVQNGATLSADGSLVLENGSGGLVIGSPGTRVTLRDSRVFDTRSDANGLFGYGVYVQDGATFGARGCLIDGNSAIGLFAVDPGTQISLRDTSVSGTRPSANGEPGWGIDVHDGASLQAKGCLLDGNTAVGLLTASSGTDVTLLDTTVRDTRPDANGAYGFGIQVSVGAELFAEGCLIDGNTDYGLFASGPGTLIDIRDSTISGTKPGSDVTASAATGVYSQDGAFLSASRLVVRSNQGPGVLVNAALLRCSECSIASNEFAGAAAILGGMLTIADSTIEGTASNANLLGGAGVYAWPWDGDPPSVTLTNTVVQDNPIAGVWLMGDGAYTLIGNTISGGAGESFGAGSRCGDAVLAIQGVTAWDGVSGLLLQENVIQDASEAGLFLDASSARLSGNTWIGNAVDLVVQDQDCASVPSEYAEAPLRDYCPEYLYPTCAAEYFWVAEPATPVDWGY